jgi:aryl-alcohol dehydrogenase-like predicted oxidoreductase
MPLGLDQKVSAVVWSPLGWGRLTGKLRRGQPMPKDTRLQNATTAAGGPQVAEEYLYRVVDALDEVAKETGKTVPQIALNWLLQRPTVANVIIGARNEEQLRQNLGATGTRSSSRSAIPSRPPEAREPDRIRAPRSLAEGAGRRTEGLEKRAPLGQ